MQQRTIQAPIIILYNQSVIQNASYTDAWVHRGDAQRALKYYNGSVESYSKAVMLDKNNTAAWSGLLADYNALKDYSNAYTAANKTTMLIATPKASNWLTEGNLLQQLGRYNEPVERYNRAIALDPQNKDAFYRQGVSLIAAGESAMAAQDFDQVLKIDPAYKQAYNAKGFALMAAGDYAGAIQAFDDALKIDPAFSQAMINKMNALLQLKKKNEAMGIFVKL